MAKKSKLKGSQEHLDQLKLLLDQFERELTSNDLRAKVKGLIPAIREIRDLGASLISPNSESAARERILKYFLKFPKTVIEGDELMVVGGIGEWARRLRELRVEFGWSIISGVTVQQMEDAGDLIEIEGRILTNLRPDDYMLLSPEQDREAALRWNIAHEIRKSDLGVQDKIIAYFRENVGRKLTGEEISYVAKGKTEWARRVRELRTEEGWPIVTKMTGLPELPVGVYVLLEDKQSEPHDRHIPDKVRAQVLERDEFSCINCGWSLSKRKQGDPRQFLELHHVQHHVDKGENETKNLRTLCNVCHDRVHAGDLKLS